MVYLAKGKYAFRNEELAIDFCKIYSRLMEVDAGFETRYLNPKIDVKKIGESEAKYVYASFEELEDKNPNLKITRLRNEKAWLCAKIRLPKEFTNLIGNNKSLYVNFKTLKSILKLFREFIADRKIPKEDEKYLKLQRFSTKFIVILDKNSENIDEYGKLMDLYQNYQARIKNIDRQIETVKMDIEDEADAIEE